VLTANKKDVVVRCQYEQTNSEKGRARCDIKRTFVAPGIGSARIAAQACPLPPLIVSAAPTSLAHALDRTANTAAANVITPLRLQQDKKAKTACNELQVDYILSAKSDPTSETLPCFHTMQKIYKRKLQA
jgi:hypothetical protein